MVAGRWLTSENDCYDLDMHGLQRFWDGFVRLASAALRRSEGFV